MNQYLYIVVAVSLGIIALFLIVFYLRRRPRPVPYMDELEGHEFETWCAELLLDQGFGEVKVTRGSRDYGVDILAEKDGITYAIQCKRYQGPVGVEAIMQTYAGRDFYERMVGVVMTNQYFTAPAVEAARKLRILLWDRGYLEQMIEEGEQDL